MTLNDADVLLGQWAIWSSSFKGQGASSSRWQRDYRPSFDPDNPSIECRAAPDEQQMLDVDTALAMVRQHNPDHFNIIKGRYCRGASYSYLQLDAARRSFILEYTSPLDTQALVYEHKYVDGHRSP